MCDACDWFWLGLMGRGWEWEGLKRNWFAVMCDACDWFWLGLMGRGWGWEGLKRNWFAVMCDACDYESKGEKLGITLGKNGEGVDYVWV